MDVTDSDFEQKVIEKSKEVPVLVDFWASWCAPCMMLKPIIEKMEHAYKGKFILAKINVDENPEISNRYGINAIPAIKLFKSGNVASEFEGLMPEPALKNWLDSNL